MGFVLIFVVAFVGAVLVATAPLDAQSRSNLGVGLLTGVVVGAVLIGVEITAERQRDLAEKRQVSAQHQSLLDYSKGRLARLVQQCAREYEWRLYNLIHDTPDDSGPPGFRATEDIRAVWRNTVWISDIDLTDPEWYRISADLERIDVSLLVASHILEQHAAQPGREEMFELEVQIADAAVRIGATADFLSQLAAPDLAQQSADVASNIVLASRTLDLGAAVGGRSVPQLPSLTLGEDGNGVTWITQPTQGMRFLREFCAYLIDLLRDGANSNSAASMAPTLQSRRLLQGDGDNDEITRRRWPALISNERATEGLWEKRFEDDSWLRAALAHGSRRASWSWGLDG